MQSTEETRQSLLKLREQYTRRATAIDADVHHKTEPVEKDFAEQATQRENDDVLNALEQDARQVINQINSALLRLDDGSFGNCVECGEEISVLRLKAIPYASLCVSCADKQD